MGCCDGPSPTAPQGMLSQVVSLGKAVVRFAAGGFRMVPLSVLEERLGICSGCERKTTVAGMDICNACGCSLSIKARMPGEFCPLGRWPDPHAVKPPAMAAPPPAPVAAPAPAVPFLAAPLSPPMPIIPAPLQLIEQPALEGGSTQEAQVLDSASVSVLETEALV